MKIPPIIIEQPIIQLLENKNDKNAIKDIPEINMIVNEFLQKIDERDKIKCHRGFIEDFFKLLKEGLGFKQLNRYTLNSMSKYTAIVVLLADIITYLRINSKTDFQKFSEGKFYYTPIYFLN